MDSITFPEIMVFAILVAAIFITLIVVACLAEEEEEYGLAAFLMKAAVLGGFMGTMFTLSWFLKWVIPIASDYLFSRFGDSVFWVSLNLLSISITYSIMDHRRHVSGKASDPLDT